MRSELTKRVSDSYKPIVTALSRVTMGFSLRRTASSEAEMVRIFSSEILQLELGFAYKEFMKRLTIFLMLVLGLPGLIEIMPLSTLNAASPTFVADSFHRTNRKSWGKADI